MILLGSYICSIILKYIFPKMSFPLFPPFTKMLGIGGVWEGCLKPTVRRNQT